MQGEALSPHVSGGIFEIATRLVEIKVRVMSAELAGLRARKGGLRLAQQENRLGDCNCHWLCKPEPGPITCLSFFFILFFPKMEVEFT